MFEVEIKDFKIANEHGNVMFYECFVVNNKTDKICAVPFKRNVKFKIYNFDEYVPDVNNHVFRSQEDLGRVSIYIQKVTFIVNHDNVEVGIRTHISPNDIDDSSFLTFDYGHGNDKEFITSDNITILTYFPEKKTDPNTRYCVGNGQTWVLNRSFYTRSHFYDYRREDIYENIYTILKNNRHQTMNIVDFVYEINSIFHDKLIYEPDTDFLNGKIYNDINDVNVLRSVVGDCEDFAFMFAACLHYLFMTFKFILKDTDPMYTFVSDIAARYIPNILICRIDNGGEKLEFHATLLLVPNVESLDPVIFEVTRPEVCGLFDKDTALYERYVKFHFLINHLSISKFKDFKTRELHNLQYNPNLYVNY